MMRRLATLVFGLAVLVLSGSAARASGPLEMRPYTVKLSDGSAFTSQSLDSTRTTAAIDVQGYAYFKFKIDFTHSGASAVRMTCQERNDSDDPWGDIQKLEDSSTLGESDSYQHTWVQPVSGDETWPWVVLNTGYIQIRCSFTATSGGAGDTITVTGVAGE